MFSAFFLLCALQLGGALLAGALDLPLPGAVLGLVTLAVVLSLRGRVARPLERVADGLIGMLPLLFVPAGVGIVAYLGLLQADFLAILLAVVPGTLLALLGVAWLFSALVERDDGSTP